mmetsp:Transcript_1580/g.2783  ORF Transcript_1580/g.2783 Transcript_1580/m.2783 type:complete len:138 (+) Transcript_1580:225-638(+)
MYDVLNKDDLAYDVVEGVSIGGLNAVVIALFPKGEEDEALKFVKQLWLSNPIKSLWNYWPTFGFMAGLWKSSLTDNTKVEELIKAIVADKELRRSVIIKTVDLITGRVVMYDEETPLDKLAVALKASAAIPLFFPPV